MQRIPLLWAFLGLLYLPPGLWAQSNSGILMFPQPPNTGATVCGDTAFFQNLIINAGTDTAFNVLLTDTLANGMQFTGPVSGDFLLDNQLSSTTTRFRIDTLAPGDTARVRYGAIARCNILDTLTAGVTPDTIKAVCQLRYFQNGQLNTDRGIVYSFNLFSPRLNIQVTPINIHLRPHIDTVCYTLEIRNTGNASLDTFYLDYFPEQQVYLYNYRPLSQGIQFNYIPYSNSYRFRVVVPNGLGPNQKVNVEICSVLRGCDPLGFSKFQLVWGCNQQLCDDNRPDMFAVSNVDLLFANPSIKAEFTVFDTASYCGSDSIAGIRMKLWNEGTGPARDFRFIYKNPHYASVSHFQFTNGGPVPPGYYSSSSSNNANLFFNQFNYDPDGPSGLTDSDNDGQFDDLLPGDTLDIVIYRKLYFPDYMSNCDANHSLIFHYASFDYLTPCNGFQNFPGHRNYRAYPYYYLRNIFPKNTYEKPVEVRDGDSSNFVFSHLRDFKHFTDPTDLISCPAPWKVTATFEVPPGISLIDQYARVTFPGQSSSIQFPVSTTPLTNGGTLITVDTGSIKGTKYAFNWKWSCQNPYSEELKIPWRMNATAGSCIPCNRCLTADTVVFRSACYPPYCHWITTDSFRVERDDFGYISATNPTPVTAQTPNVNDTSAWPYDTIRAIIVGKVQQDAPFDSAWVKISYPMDQNQDVLEFISAIAYKNGTSCGTTITAVLDSSSQNPRTYNWDILIPGACAQYLDGDSISCEIFFRVRNRPNIPPVADSYLIDYIRGELSVSDNGSRISCHSRGQRFRIMRNRLRAKLSDIQTDCSVERIDLKLSNWGSLSRNGQNETPNEYRGWFRLGDTVRFFIPQGYHYLPNTARYYWFDGNYLRSYPPVQERLIPNSKGNWLEMIDPNWPWTDTHWIYHTNVHLTSRIQFNVQIDSCDILVPPYTGGNRKDTFISRIEMNEYAYTNDPQVTETRIMTDTTIASAIPPRLKLDPGQALIDTRSTIPSWKIRLCNKIYQSQNSNVSDATYVWWSVRPSNPDVEPYALINLKSNRIYPLQKSGNTWYVGTDSLDAFDCNDFELLARYGNCILPGIDTLDVKVGWSCERPTDAPFNLQCSGDSTQLFLRYQNGDLFQTVLHSPTLPFNFCNPVPFEVELLNPGGGDNYNLNIRLDSIPGFSYHPGSAFVFWPAGNSPQPLPPPQGYPGSGEWGWNLSEILMTVSGQDTGWAGNYDTLANRIRIQFSLQPDCNFNVGSQLGIRATARTNCGDSLKTPVYLSAPLLIYGLPAPDQLISKLQANQLHCLDSTQTLTVTIINPGSVGSGHESVILSLPQGYVFDNAFQAIYPRNFSTNYLTWDPQLNELQTSVNLLPGDSLKFSIRVRKQTSLCGNWDFRLFTRVKCPVKCPGRPSCNLSVITSDITLQDSSCCPCCCQVCNVNPKFRTYDICLGDTAWFMPLENRPGSEHLWDFGNGSFSQFDTAWHVYGQAGTYLVTHSLGLACCDTLSSTDTLRVHPFPKGHIVARGHHFCEGDTIRLSIQPDTTMGQAGHIQRIIWFQNGVMVDTTRELAVSQSGLYSALLISPFGCTNACPAIQLWFHPKPDFDIPDHILCLRDTLCLNPGDFASPPRPPGKPYHSVIWSTGSFDDRLCLSRPGVYWVTVSDSNWCMHSDTFSIDTNLISLNLPDTTICLGDTLCYEADKAFLTYRWSTGDSTSRICLHQQGQYQLSVQDSSGCWHSDTLTLSLDTIPDPDFTFTTVCAEDTTCFTSTITGHHHPQIQHEWYTWLTGNQVLLSRQQSFCFPFPGTGSYVVEHRITLPCGSKRTTKIVEVLPLPSGTIKQLGQNPFCDRDSVQLTVIGNYSTLWWERNNQFHKTGDTIWVNQSGKYQAVLTDSNGCLDTCLALQLQTFGAPRVSLPDTVWGCGNVTLDPGTGNYKYLWSNGATTNTIQATTNRVSQNFQVKVSYSGRDSLCDTVLSTVVAQVPVQISVNMNGRRHICMGRPFTVNAMVRPANRPYRYIWSNCGNTVFQSGPSPVLNHTYPLPAGQTQTPFLMLLCLEVTDTLTGCTADQQLFISVYDPRKDPTFCPPLIIIPPVRNLISDQKPNLYPKGQGKIVSTPESVTNRQATSGSSPENAEFGPQHHPSSPSVRIFPNPAYPKRELMVVYDLPGTSHLRLVLYDNLGQMVGNWGLPGTQGKRTPILPSLPKGLYQIRILDQNKPVFTQKLLIQDF